MKALLISANRTSINLPVFPLGLAWLGASLRQAGHEVEILDLLGDGSPEAAIAHVVDAFRPRLIGFSVRNIDNQDPFHPAFFLPDVQAVVVACRRVSLVPLVVGGAGYSIFPRAALDRLAVDYGVVGEGERALCGIARAFECDGPIASIPGVIVRGCTRPPWRATIRNLDCLPPPARHLLDVRPYAAGPMPIQSITCSTVTAV